MTRPIDLRSDTVTKPSEAMRAAMAAADVGDDWYGDDPTVNVLQDTAAEVVGKEAALYVATGTMGNQIALHVQARAGHFVAAEQNSHVATTEVSTSAILSGIAFHGIPSEDGRITPEQVDEALAPDPYDVEVIDVLSLENTHQVGGGTPWPVDELRAVTAVARDRGVRVHMDGARLFNACAATGAHVTDYTSNVDSVMFCLSKGLGAPIGSMLCGSEDFIRDAKRSRILLGGDHGRGRADRPSRRTRTAARGPCQRPPPGRGDRRGDAGDDRSGGRSFEHPVRGHRGGRRRRLGGA
jgi:threonine aldolase